MKPPIIVLDDDSIDVFESVQEAERYLEPYDAGDLTAFDADGRRVYAEVVEESVPMLFGLFKTKRPRVVLRAAPSENREELVHLLRSHLQHVSPTSSDEGFDDVLKRAVRTFGFTK